MIHFIHQVFPGNSKILEIHAGRGFGGNFEQLTGDDDSSQT